MSPGACRCWEAAAVFSSLETSRMTLACPRRALDFEACALVRGFCHPRKHGSLSVPTEPDSVRRKSSTGTELRPLRVVVPTSLAALPGTEGGTIWRFVKRSVLESILHTTPSQPFSLSTKQGLCLGTIRQFPQVCTPVSPVVQGSTADPYPLLLAPPPSRSPPPAPCWLRACMCASRGNCCCQ